MRRSALRDVKDRGPKGSGSLELAALIPSEAIVDSLESTEKKGVLKEMVDALVAAGRVRRGAAKSVVEALMKREELGSTAIGKGVAVPHAKHGGVQGLVVAFGRSKKGIEFASLDGQPVYLVFLLLSSKHSSDRQTEPLAMVTRLARDGPFRHFLRDAKDAKELEGILHGADYLIQEGG